MLDYFSQHLNIEFNEIAMKCGIPLEDIELSEELSQILGIPIQKGDEEESEDDVEEGKETPKKKNCKK